MAIDGGLRDKLTAGTTLVARYRKREHTAQVVAGEDGKLRYRLGDGREFKSPSAAGSAVMDGQACNGWRFWSLATDEAPANAPPKRVAAKRKAGASPKSSAKKAAPGKKPRAARPATVEDVDALATEDAPSY